MITIDQLLESVDLDFEPRWITKDKNGNIVIFAYKPKTELGFDRWFQSNWGSKQFGPIKLAEFADKDWAECIYKVPRKTTGNLEKIEVGYNNSLKAKDWQDVAHAVGNKINELVDAVNELKSNN